MKIFSVGMREWKDRALSNPRVAGMAMTVWKNTPITMCKAAIGIGVGGGIAAAGGLITTINQTVIVVEMMLGCMVVTQVCYSLQKKLTDDNTDSKPHIQDAESVANEPRKPNIKT